MASIITVQIDVQIIPNTKVLIWFETCWNFAVLHGATNVKHHDIMKGASEVCSFEEGSESQF